MSGLVALVTKIFIILQLLFLESKSLHHGFEVDPPSIM
jgi:hypothetical protein